MESLTRQTDLVVVSVKREGYGTFFCVLKQFERIS